MGVIARVVVLAASLVTGMALISEAAHLVLSVSDGKISRTSRAADAAPDMLSVLDASSFPPRSSPRSFSRGPSSSYPP